MRSRRRCADSYGAPQDPRSPPLKHTLSTCGQGRSVDLPWSPAAWARISEPPVAGFHVPRSRSPARAKGPSSGTCASPMSDSACPAFCPRTRGSCRGWRDDRRPPQKSSIGGRSSGRAPSARLWMCRSSSSLRVRSHSSIRAITNVANVVIAGVPFGRPIIVRRALNAARACRWQRRDDPRRVRGSPHGRSRAWRDTAVQRTVAPAGVHTRAFPNARSTRANGTSLTPASAVAATGILDQRAGAGGRR